MRFSCLALCALLAACGSGGGGSFDPVTRVRIVDGLHASAQAYWDESGTAIDIDSLPLPAERATLLQHELFHVITRIAGHNPHGCVSYEDALEYDPPLFAPCALELQQVRDALGEAGYITISFPQDPAAAYAGASWWNDALDRVAVRLAGDTVP